MNRIIGVGVALMVVLGLVTLAKGEEGAAKPEKSVKTGIVKKVDVEGSKIVVMVTRELTFAINAETKIVQGDAVKTLADIKVGDSVTVEYSFAAKDNRVASKVAIAVPAAAQ